VDGSEVVVLLAEVDIPEEADKALEGGIVVCEVTVTEMDVGADTDVLSSDTDVAEVPATVEALATEEVVRARDRV
jgi:hypothetical protein